MSKEKGHWPTSIRSKAGPNSLSLPIELFYPRKLIASRVKENSSLNEALSTCLFVFRVLIIGEILLMD